MRLAAGFAYPRKDNTSSSRVALTEKTSAGELLPGKGVDRWMGWRLSGGNGTIWSLLPPLPVPVPQIAWDFDCDWLELPFITRMRENPGGMFLLSDLLSDWNIHKKYV